MSERIQWPSDELVDAWVEQTAIADNEGIRPLHKILFQQAMRRVRALRAKLGR